MAAMTRTASGDSTQWIWLRPVTLHLEATRCPQRGKHLSHAWRAARCTVLSIRRFREFYAVWQSRLPVFRTGGTDSDLLPRQSRVLSAPIVVQPAYQCRWTLPEQDVGHPETRA